MILDACVLTDFIKADRTILKRVVKYVGPLHVVSPVVEEVNEIKDEDELRELGIIVNEPEIADAFAAASQIGPTSFEDQLCLLTALRHDFICVTNDKTLRRCCREQGVHLLWGLELLSKLHKAGGITSRDAEMVAQSIHESNPKHITAEIVSRFIEVIRKQESKA
jgi:rRNA-processing protein FCF1